MSKVRFALVGAGVMGSFHARVIAGSDRCRLVRVIDPVEDAGAKLAARYGAAWTPEFDGLNDVDAVVIAAATDAHHELAMRVLEIGRPLLVEKPVASELGRSEEVVVAAEARQVPMMCGYVERFNPAMRTVLPILDEPLHVTAVRHSPYAARIRTGVAWDLLIHDVDACLRIVGGEPERVRAGLGYFHPVSEPSAEDVAEAVLSFSSGVLATASASRLGQRKIRSITITEIDRSVELDLLRRDVTIYRHIAHEAADQDGRGYRQQAIIEIPELATVQEPLAAQLDHFLDLIEGAVDMDEERRSILPAHRVIDHVMAARAHAG